MSERASFYRKISYLVSMLALAFFIYWLSTPATASKAGGKLAQLREKYHLGQSNLGEIDPASETMRFMTLGLRGVADAVLWHQANQYKMKEAWTNFTATLEQLAKLNPNFLNVWKYQAWNLTYNVSVEFDDYHDRYYYVRRGIEYLKEGERYNLNSPVLLSELGWFIGHKIGRADEHVQYRRLFKADDDFHPADRPPDQRDSWLVSKEWYQKAIDAVANGKSIGKKSPREFYSDPAKAQINYAEAIEEEGSFDKARRAWITGGDEWRAFGRLPIRHSFGDLLRMGDEPKIKEEIENLKGQLEALKPGVREQLTNQKLQSLSPEDRKLHETPLAQVAPTQANKWYEIETKLIVTDHDVADRIAADDPDTAKQAWRLARQLEENARLLRFTTSYKETLNYDYWQLRCDFEQSANALAARELMYNAHQAQREANLSKAKELFQQGFAKWKQAFEEFPAILDDAPVIGENTVDYAKQYRSVLDRSGESLDESFPLWDALAKFDQEGEFATELAKYRQNLPADKKATDEKEKTSK